MGESRDLLCLLQTYSVHVPGRWQLSAFAANKKQVHGQYLWNEAGVELCQSGTCSAATELKPLKKVHYQNTRRREN